MIVHVMHTALADGDDLFRLLIAAHWPSGFNPAHHGGGVIKRLAACCRSLAIRHVFPTRFNTRCRRDDLTAPAALINTIFYYYPLTPHSTAPLLSEVLNLGRMADRTCNPGRCYLDHRASTKMTVPRVAGHRATATYTNNRRSGAPRPIRCPTANQSYLID